MNLSHALVAVVLLMVGLYFGAKNPGLLSKVTMGAASA